MTAWSRAFLFVPVAGAKATNHIMPSTTRINIHCLWWRIIGRFAHNLGWLFYTIKEKKELRDVTSHIFSQTTHVALSQQSCHVGWGDWGPERSQPCQVLSKSVKGFLLPEGSKSAIFLCLVLWLIQQLTPNLWLWPMRISSCMQNVQFAEFSDTNSV